MTARYNGEKRAKPKFPSRAAPVPAAAVGRRLRAPSFPLVGERGRGEIGERLPGVVGFGRLIAAPTDCGGSIAAGNWADRVVRPYGWRR